MKFAILFLIFAFVTIQGFQTVVTQSTDNDLNEFYSALKLLIEKYKIILYVIGDHLPKLLKDVKDTTIAEHIPDLLDSFYKKFGQLALHNAQCFENNKSNLQGLYMCLVEQMKYNEEEPALKELNEEIRSFVVVAKELAMNVSQAVGVEGDI